MEYPTELVDFMIIIVMIFLFGKAFTDLNHKKDK